MVAASSNYSVLIQAPLADIAAFLVPYLNHGPPLVVILGVGYLEGGGVYSVLRNNTLSLSLSLCTPSRTLGAAPESGSGSRYYQQPGHALRGGSAYQGASYLAPA